MNNRLLFALAIASTGLAGTSLAADEPGSWYVSPLVQYTGLNNGRQAKDDFSGQLGLGYNLSPDWAVEGAASNGSFDRNAGGTVRLQSYMVDALRKFTVDSPVQPYLLGGVGALRERVTPDMSSQQTNMGAEIGAGLLYGLGSQTGATRFALRAEAKYRLDFINNAAYTNNRPGDVIAGVGFVVSFGNQSAAAAPIAASMPTPPPPAPAPVTPPPPPPAAIAPPPPAPAPAAIHLESVYFATDKSVITPAAAKTLAADIDTLKAHPGLVVAVEGNTDNRGSVAYNMGLAKRRVDVVEKYLKDHGVSNTLQPDAYGESKPVADNKTDDGKAKNRRVDLEVVGGR